MSKQITHDGVVVKIDGRDVSVRIVQTSACSGCHARGACMASDSAEKVIVADGAGQSFQIGEMVTLVGANSMAWSAMAYAFVVPTVLALVVLFVAVPGLGEGAGAGAVVAMLAVYYIVLYALRGRLKTKFTFGVVKRPPL